MKVKLLIAQGIAGEALDINSVVDVSERDAKYLIASKRAEKTENQLKKIKLKAKGVSPVSDSECAKELKKVSDDLEAANHKIDDLTEQLDTVSKENEELRAQLEPSK